MGYGVDGRLARHCALGQLLIRTDHDALVEYMSAVNDQLSTNSDEFFAYDKPKDFRIEHRKVELFHTGSEAPKKQPKDEVGEVPALHLAGTVAVSREQPGERALVPSQGTSRGRAAAAVECRRSQPERAVPHLQHARHCGPAAEHAVSRYSPAGRFHARRLRRVRQCGTHHRRHAARHRRHPLLHGLAGAARLLAARHRRHQPGLVLRVSGQRARSPHSCERLQSRVDGIRRRGLDGPVDAAHPRRAWKRC